MNNYPFIHLRTQSSYSLSESALKIEKLVKLAKTNKMPSIALTDNNNLFGALEFAIKSIENGIQPIIGTSINILDIISLINFILGSEIPTNDEMLLSDLNQDGVINILDVVMLVNLILN